MVQIEERHDISSIVKKKGVCDYSGNTVRTKVSNLKSPTGFFKPAHS